MAELLSVEPSSTRMSSNKRKSWAKTLSIASAMKASAFRKMVITETLNTIHLEVYELHNKHKRKKSLHRLNAKNRKRPYAACRQALGRRGHALMAPNLPSSTFGRQSPTAIRGRSCRSARRGSMVA